MIPSQLRPFLPFARYAVVVLSGLFLFTASTNYLGSAALQQLRPASKPAAASNTVVHVPDPPVATTRPQPAEPRSVPAQQQGPATAVTTAPTPHELPAAAAQTQPAAAAGTDGSLVAVAAGPSDDGPTVIDASQPIPNSGLEPVGGVATHVVLSSVNFRAAPSNEGAKLGVLHAGDRVTVTASEGGWMQVEDGGDVRGWVWGSFLASL